MADTFTNDLRLRLQESGSNSGNWGNLLNTTITNIASALGQGSEAIPNASTHTITLADGTADEARSLYLKCTGGGQACTVTLGPNTISKVWIIDNATSYTLTFSQGSGASVAIAAGAVKVIATDGAGSGAAVVDTLDGLEGSLSTLAVGGELSTPSAGTSNTRIGVNAGNSITSGGNYNVVVGDEAGTAITTGDLMTAVGYKALFTEDTGERSTAVGAFALTAQNAAVENYNTAVGYAAGTAVTTGVQNTLIGALAGDAITTAANNTALGYSALGLNTTGAGNTAIGRTALENNTTASDNVAVGRATLSQNTTGANNTAIGSLALLVNTTGASNVAVGINAGASITTASTNTLIGKDSGRFITTGANNTILGSYHGNQDGLDIRTASNYIVLSDGAGNPQVHIQPSGNVVIKRSDFSSINAIGCYNDTTAAAANLVVASSGSFVRSTSSLRYKNTVNDATHGLTELLTLRPVTYKGNNNGETIFGGLIAEEVHDAGLTEFVQYDDEERPDALAYGNMVSLCIKAIQEQQTLIESLTARVAELEG